MARQAAVRQEIFDRTRKREERFRLAVEKQKMLHTRRAIEEKQEALRAEAEQRKRRRQIVLEAQAMDAKLQEELERGDERDIAARRVRSVRESHSRALERNEKRAALAGAMDKVRQGLDLLDATAEVAVIRRFTVEDA